MATTAAVLRIRPRLPVSVSAGRRTSANFDLSVRLVSGVYSASSIPASTNLSNLRAWLPSIRVPLVDERNCMTTEWYRFIHYVVETVLGGADGSTVSDIATAVVTSSATSATVSQAAVALTQQADANAQALAAAVQVVQTAALPGASQIPIVQLTNRGYQR
jgi:hypothetical protein